MAGERRSEVTTTVRRVEMDVTIGLGGRHVDVIVPYDARAFGERMVALGDRAFERYTTWLGAPPIKERCPIHFIASSRVYSDLWAFSHSSGARPAGLRAWFITGRISGRFRELFGDPAVLEASWQASLRSEPPTL